MYEKQNKVLLRENKVLKKDALKAKIVQESKIKKHRAEKVSEKNKIKEQALQQKLLKDE